MYLLLVSRISMTYFVEVSTLSSVHLNLLGYSPNAVEPQNVAVLFSGSSLSKNCTPENCFVRSISQWTSVFKWERFRISQAALCFLLCASLYLIYFSWRFWIDSSIVVVDALCCFLCWCLLSILPDFSSLLTRRLARCCDGCISEMPAPSMPV